MVSIAGDERTLLFKRIIRKNSIKLILRSLGRTLLALSPSFRERPLSPYWPGDQTLAYNDSLQMLPENSAPIHWRTIPTPTLEHVTSARSIVSFFP